MKANTYKQLIFAFVLVLGSFTLMMCGSGGGGSDSKDKSVLIGSWYYTDAPEEEVYIVLTFLDDEKYVIVNDEIDEDEDAEGEDGFEIGTYKWAKDGVFTTSAVVDDNGEWGLSHPCENEVVKMKVVGDTLTLETDGEVGEGCSGEGANDAIELKRVESKSDPLIGTWILKDNMSKNYFALVSLMSDGRYLMMENNVPDGGVPGIESGGYDLVDGEYEFQADVDTNGEWGLDEGRLDLEVDGNTLIGNDEEGEFSLERVR